jgi:hypothetical protein
VEAGGWWLKFSFFVSYFFFLFCNLMTLGAGTVLI